MRWRCCIVELGSNIKLSLVSNINSSILIEGTQWDGPPSYGDEIVSNIKMSLVSNTKTRLVSNIKSSILREGTLCEWISNCGYDFVLYQDWSLVLYQGYGPPFIEVVILCDIFLVMVTECYKYPLRISYP